MVQTPRAVTRSRLPLNLKDHMCAGAVKQFLRRAPALESGFKCSDMA